MDQNTHAAPTAAQPPCAQWALLALLALSSPAAAQMTTGAPPPDADSAERANAPPGATIPPKKASVILVHTAEPAAAAYKTAGRLLAARGYGLQASDPTFGAITTTFKANSLGPVQISVLVLEDSAGSVVQFTGVYKYSGFNYISRGMGEEPQAIQYGGQKGSVMRKMWEELYGVASSYPGGTLEYRAQPK